jgi:CRP-like cAMP-binding protein
VTRDGLVVNHVIRGDGFGEHALLRDVPRQATVTADSDVVLYRLDKSSFLEMISSSPSAALMAETVITEYGDSS